MASEEENQYLTPAEKKAYSLIKQLVDARIFIYTIMTVGAGSPEIHSLFARYTPEEFSMDKLKALPRGVYKVIQRDSRRQFVTLTKISVDEKGNVNGLAGKANLDAK